MFDLNSFLSKVNNTYKNEPEFVQAVTEVFSSLVDFINSNPKYTKYNIPERIIIPDRVIIFKVTWLDDNNNVQVNTGYRVQFNNSLGPYKGGLRFHPSVNLSILKFLGFEQIFKNSLTGLRLGGGKGGSDFNPHGKSEMEIMKFSQSFVSELYKYIGDDIDVPAGDIGVGTTEIGYMFGQFKKITNRFNGVLTGKGINYGGSYIRPEATGYGVVYFLENVLKHRNDEIFSKRVLVSGSGNVAQFAVEKAIALGAKVITVSDSSGFVYDESGISQEKLEFIKYLKNIKKARISELAEKFNLQFFPNSKPWSVKADIALPCATQNEIDIEDAKTLVSNQVRYVVEGSNMATTNEAIEYFCNNSVVYVPGKASNAGGVAVSGLEMAQNSSMSIWTKEDVDLKLREIMNSIHSKCLEFGVEKNNRINYVKGANIAGFKKVADAMIELGI